MELLACLRFHGFLLFPGVPNTTAVTQEMDQSYGSFQSKLRSNLEIIVDERLHAEKSTALAPWIVELFVFGGEDPKRNVLSGQLFRKDSPMRRTSMRGQKWGPCPSPGNVYSIPRFGARLEMETTTNRLWLVSSKSITLLPAPHWLMRATTATLCSCNSNLQLAQR